MSLNTDTGKYDLLSEDQAVRYASWAVYWLSEVLSYELQFNWKRTRSRTAANLAAGLASAPSACKQVVGCIESILGE